MSNEAQATDEICGGFNFPVQYYYHQELVDAFGDDVPRVARAAFEEVAQIGIFNSVYFHYFKYDGVSVMVQSAMDWEDRCLLLGITLGDPPAMELPEDFPTAEQVVDQTKFLN